jgi:hypothetical protein
MLHPRIAQHGLVTALPEASGVRINNVLSI